ncbi:MAG: hypothetical protein ABJC13_07575 [Acidobacteriota bacterium]
MANELKDHNDGERDGANASFFDEVGLNWNPFLSEAYKKGFRNGMANKPRRTAKESSPTASSNASSDDGLWPIALILYLAFGVVWIIFVIIGWAISRPWRFAVGVLFVLFFAILHDMASIPQDYFLPFSNYINTFRISDNPTPPVPSTPIHKEPEPSDSPFVSLGHFSGDSYELELYRDDESGGQVMGLITAFPQDVSKMPSVGEVYDVVGTGSDGPLSFRTTWVDYLPSFRGNVNGDQIEGDYDTTFETEPRHVIFRRYTPQDATTYANREEWSKHVAEQLACCGPGTTDQ